MPESPYTPAAEPESPIPAPAPVSEEEEVPFAEWTAVLEQLKTTCMPLYGVLADSTALLKGGKLIICTENAMFKELFQRDNNKTLLRKAIENATGTTYRVGLRRKQTVLRQEIDPLTRLLDAGRAAGVPVSEED